MKAVLIGGQDRTTDVGQAIVAAAAQRRAAAPDPVDDRVAGILALRQAGSESEFNARLIELLQQRAGLDTGPFPIPRKPGRAGRMVARAREALWKLLRYQHDRMAFQQSALNLQTAYALEFERDELLRKVRALEERVAALEAGKSGEGQHGRAH